MLSMRTNSVYTAILYSLLILTLASCYAKANPADMQTAKAEVEAALAEVTPPDFVTVIRTVPEDFDDSEHTHWGDRVCAYARRWVIIVSSHPQDEVVKAYVAQLEAVGFQLKGGQHAHTATLYRGNRESVDVDYLTEGSWFSSRAEYEQLHQSYATVMELYFQTIVPDRKTCGQWSEDELSTPYYRPTVTPRP